MAGLYKKYQDQGLHIIGMERQGSSKEEIVKLCTSKGVTYQVTQNGTIVGSKSGGIPHAFLFGADGNLVAEGHPVELEKKIPDLLKEAICLAAGPGPYKALAPLVDQIKSSEGMAMGQVLKTAKGKMKSAKADEAAEAKTLADALTVYAKGLLDAGGAMKESDPLAALNRFERVALLYAGDEIGTDAKKQADTLRNDPKVKKELAAAQMFKQIEDMVERLRPVAGVKEFKSEGFRKVNADALQAIASGCAIIKQQYPGTKGAEKAEELVSQFK